MWRGKERRGGDSRRRRIGRGGEGRRGGLGGERSREVKEEDEDLPEAQDRKGKGGAG